MGVDEDGCGPSLLFALFPGGSPCHLPTSCLVASDWWHVDTHLSSGQRPTVSQIPLGIAIGKSEGRYY